ncbi:MAG: sigma-70 family RNA polymerase sigma factor [Roseivirga sp.]|nr:sigma-70 family RNA polymerase sigma factor [Roseivirga sp.]
MVSFNINPSGLSGMPDGSIPAYMNPHCQVVAPVFQQYRDILARYIQSKVKDPIDSEELLSQVMMKIYDHCEKLEGVRNTEAWLVTIARNAVTDYFRMQQKRPESSLPVSVALEEETNVMEDLEACIPSLIAKLPEKYAQPLADYELRGIPQKSLAVQYGMSESGLKSRVQRGRKMLKELFTEYCGHLIEEQESCGDCNC